MIKAYSSFKFIIIYIFIFAFLANFVSAECTANWFDFYRDDGTRGTTFYVGYKGSTNSIPNHIVKNLNNVCGIKCIFTTSQGKSGNIPVVSGDYIPAGATSPRFSIPVVADGSTILTTTVTCQDEVSDVWCSGEQGCLSKQITLSWDYCGDGKVNGPESCDGTSKDCSGISSKYYIGISAPCKSDCSGYNTNSCKFCGDGIVNGPESCDGGSNNGKVCTPSYNSACSYCTNSCTLQTQKGGYCGDGVINGNENCNSCPQDAGCQNGEQCSSSGQCISIVNDNNNCGAIGQRCDTIPKFSLGGSSYCSSDNTQAIQKGTRTWYECVAMVCQQKTSDEDKIEQCGNNFCQEGHCGCSEGYGPCQSSGKCEKKDELENNAYCKCSFQCKSGICRADKCIEGLISNFNSEKTSMKPGEEAVVSFTAHNPFDSPVTASLVVKSGSGAGTSAVISGQDCRESQCTTSLTIPAKNNADVSFTLGSKSISNIPLTATMTYNLEGKPITVTKDITIKVTECGREDCTGGLNRLINRLQEIKLTIGNFSISALTIGVILIVLIVLAFVLRIVLHKRPHYKEIKVKHKEVKESELKRENKIKKELNILSLFKKAKKCPSCGAKLKPHHLFCSKCGKKILKEKDKLLICSKCGEPLKEDTNYCYKCGGKAKKSKE